MARSRGSYELGRRDETQPELAEKLGKSQTLVSFWISGERAPSARNRDLIEAVLGIEVRAWDQPVPRPPKPRPRAEAPLDASVGALATRLIAILRAELERLEKERGTPLERVRLGEKIASTLAQLAKMTGESAEISESKILKTPAWKQLRDRMLEALAPFPDAARAIGEALQKVGA